MIIPWSVGILYRYNMTYSMTSWIITSHNYDGQMLINSWSGADIMTNYNGYHNQRLCYCNQRLVSNKHRKRPTWLLWSGDQPVGWSFAVFCSLLKAMETMCDGLSVQFEQPQWKITIITPVNIPIRVYQFCDIETRWLSSKIWSTWKQ